MTIDKGIRAGHQIISVPHGFFQEELSFRRQYVTIQNVFVQEIRSAVCRMEFSRRNCHYDDNM